MFGDKENDGFLDAVLRKAKNIGITLIAIVIIAYIWDDFTRAIRERNYPKLFKYLLVTTILIVWIAIAKKIEKDNAVTPYEVDYSSTL